MIAADEFWNKIAEKYSRDQIKDMASYEYKLAKTQEHMRPDMAVLEFACGTGSTALIHAPHVAKYHAVDLSSEMIRIARAKDGADKIRFEVGDFTTMALEPESVGMVQGHSILHLLDDPAAAIRKAYDTLKPGGVFVTSTACLGKLWWLKLALPIAQMLGKAPSVTWFTEDALRQMMRDAGFEIVEDWKPEGGITALFLIAKKPG
ncbi:class I SAM-dependent methyltransferase [Aliiroseovarius crassostreae]|uniref:class I SAM-dependent methyltransferase n=1 Tax=Aliiroseovarius crassostreae TaxID=154981 RepID=UPI00220D1DCD|nr:methyltransferase domain-containing protein [Aliiroseovarius crassostreae]UWQ04698.1 methyltransferase domain-containing protein [Aliiroseovarius crassostreae]